MTDMDLWMHLQLAFHVQTHRLLTLLTLLVKMSVKLALLQMLITLNVLTALLVHINLQLVKLVVFPAQLEARPLQVLWCALSVSESNTSLLLANQRV
jgi:hypothetical protein